MFCVALASSNASSLRRVLRSLASPFIPSSDSNRDLTVSSNLNAVEICALIDHDRRAEMVQRSVPSGRERAPRAGRLGDGTPAERRAENPSPPPAPPLRSRGPRGRIPSVPGRGTSSAFADGLVALAEPPLARAPPPPRVDRGSGPGETGLGAPGPPPPVRAPFPESGPPLGGIELGSGRGPG
jgi:hypothetical protein